MTRIIMQMCVNRNVGYFFAMRFFGISRSSLLALISLFLVFGFFVSFSCLVLS